jgi:hypothetical protein
MIKNYTEFFRTLKINEDMEMDTPSDVSTEDLVRQLSYQLGIDISQYNMDDICDNIDVDGLSTNESIKVIKKHLKQLNG